MRRTEIVKELDSIMDHYCSGCLLKDHMRSSYGRRTAHQFCLSQCTVGEKIRKLGDKLR